MEEIIILTLLILMILYLIYTEEIDAYLNMLSRTPKIKSVITLCQLKKRMKKGDIFFIKGTSGLSFMINFTTNCEFSHVFMATDNINIINNIPVDMTNIKNKRDADIYPLMNYLKPGYSKKMYYLPINNSFKGDFDFKKYVGSKYSHDDAGYAYFPNTNTFKPLIPRRKNMFCSEYVAAILKESILPNLSHPITYTPKELYFDLVDDGRYYSDLFEVDVSEFISGDSLWTVIKKFFYCYDKSFM